MVKTAHAMFRTAALESAGVADEKHGENILILDIRPLTPIADYLLIITANSSPHVRALAEEIESWYSRNAIALLRRDGGYTSMWIVLDYGGIVIHIMQKETREFYALEKLWRDARRISWSKNSYGKK